MGLAMVLKGQGIKKKTLPRKLSFKNPPTQKLIRIDACITLGVRAVVGVPNVLLVCLMAAVQTLVAEQAAAGLGFTWTKPKTIAPSMSLKFARLKMLYISQRN